MFIRLSRGKSVSLASLIPNLLTTAALCSALASIFSLRENWAEALFAIFLSALFDALDGRAARLLRVSSGFGAVLDSLSDFVAFGVAPAIILHQWIFHLDAESLRVRDDPYALLNLIAVIVFPLCAGLRLARFTAAVPAGKAPGSGAAGTSAGQPVAVPSPSAANYFTGMPTPAAAGAALVPPMIEASKMGMHIDISPTVTAVYVLGIAVLMISRVPMFSFKKLRVSRMWVAPLLVVVGVLVVLMWRDVWSTLSVIALAYLLSAPLSLYMRRKARRAELAAAGLTAEPE